MRRELSSAGRLPCPSVGAGAGLSEGRSYVTLAGEQERSRDARTAQVNPPRSSGGRSRSVSHSPGLGQPPLWTPITAEGRQRVTVCHIPRPPRPLTTARRPGGVRAGPGLQGDGGSGLAGAPTADPALVTRRNYWPQLLSPACVFPPGTGVPRTRRVDGNTSPRDGTLGGGPRYAQLCTGHSAGTAPLTTSHLEGPCRPVFRVRNSEFGQRSHPGQTGSDRAADVYLSRALDPPAPPRSQAPG